MFVFPVENGIECFKTDGFSQALTRLIGHAKIEKFVPRDLRLSFKTLTGKAGVSKEYGIGYKTMRLKTFPVGTIIGMIALRRKGRQWMSGMIIWLVFSVAIDPLVKLNLACYSRS